MEELWHIRDIIEAWESEGGALSPGEFGSTGRGVPGPSPKRMAGTVNQVEWAEKIRARVSAEFDRVAKAFQSVADKQSEQNRRDTRAVIAILEEKRAEVMASGQAGYFIHDWQDLTDQVRRMIAQDSRYKTIKANRGRDNNEG